MMFRFARECCSSFCIPRMVIFFLHFSVPCFLSLFIRFFFFFLSFVCPSFGFFHSCFLSSFSYILSLFLSFLVSLFLSISFLLLVVWCAYNDKMWHLQVACNSVTHMSIGDVNSRHPVVQWLRNYNEEVVEAAAPALGKTWGCRAGGRGAGGRALWYTLDVT